MRKRRIVIGIVEAMLAASTLCGQSTAIPTWWFAAPPKSVLADPLFPTLPLTTRRQILSQIDPKFAKMKADDQDRFLWHTETDYLPKATSPKQIFAWNPTDPRCSSELLEVGWISSAISKRMKVQGLSIQAAFERFSFLHAHIRIENGTSDSVLIRPQIFVVDVLSPKRSTLFYEYPSRVSYVFTDAALKYSPGYIPTDRTTIRSGATGRTLATIEAPDPVAKQEVKEVASSMVSGSLNYAATVQPKSLKEGSLAPGASTEGDVWFEANDKARELVLRIFISDSAFEIPFTLPKR